MKKIRFTTSYGFLFCIYMHMYIKFTHNTIINFEISKYKKNLINSRKINLDKNFNFMVIIIINYLINMIILIIKKIGIFHLINILYHLLILLILLIKIQNFFYEKFKKL